MKPIVQEHNRFFLYFDGGANDQECKTRSLEILTLKNHKQDR